MKTPRLLLLAALALAAARWAGADDEVNTALKKAAAGAKHANGVSGTPQGGGSLAAADAGKVVEIDADGYDTAKSKKFVLAIFNNAGKDSYNNTGKPALNKLAAKLKGKVVVGQFNGSDDKGLMAKIKKAYSGKQCGVYPEGDNKDGYPIFLYIHNDKLAKPRSTSEGDTVDSCCFNGTSKDKHASFEAKLNYTAAACYKL